MLFYYFGESYDELFGSRLIVVEGDLTRDGIAEGDFPPFDLAIQLRGGRFALYIRAK